VTTTSMVKQQPAEAA